MSLTARTFGWLRDGLGNLAAAREIEDNLGPFTFGTIFYVDANNGNDLNDGLSQTQAKKTVLAAYDLTTSGAHDIILMSANSAHVFTAQLDVSKNRVHFVGAGGGTRYMGQRTRWTMGVTTGSTIALLKVTGVGCTFTNIKMTSADTLSTSLYCVADGGEFTQFTYCWFEKNTDLDQAGAAELLCNADTGFYKNCTIGNGIYTVAAARQNVLFTREKITGKVARDVIFEDTIFMSRCNDSAFVNCRVTNNDVERLFLFKNCTFVAVKTSPASQADVFGIAVALSDARAVLQGSTIVDNIGEVASTAGVFSNFATPNDAGAISIAVT